MNNTTKDIKTDSSIIELSDIRERNDFLPLLKTVEKLGDDVMKTVENGPPVCVLHGSDRPRLGHHDIDNTHPMSYLKVQPFKGHVRENWIRIGYCRDIRPLSENTCKFKNTRKRIGAHSDSFTMIEYENKDESTADRVPKVGFKVGDYLEIAQTDWDDDKHENVVIDWEVCKVVEVRGVHRGCLGCSKVTGFMFWDHPDLKLINENVDEEWMKRQSGGSYGCAMRMVQYILKNGADKYLKEVKNRSDEDQVEDPVEVPI